jgi:hypothetical protein
MKLINNLKNINISDESNSMDIKGILKDSVIVKYSGLFKLKSLEFKVCYVSPEMLLMLKGGVVKNGMWHDCGEKRILRTVKVQLKHSNVELTRLMKVSIAPLISWNRIMFHVKAVAFND